MSEIGNILKTNPKKYVLDDFFLKNAQQMEANSYMEKSNSNSVMTEIKHSLIPRRIIWVGLNIWWAHCVCRSVTFKPCCCAEH